MTGGRSWSASARVIFVLCIAGFVGLRGAAVLTSIESLAHEEELYRGTIARELTVGLKRPLWDYQADHYQGGSLVVGLLAAPLFSVAGPRLVVLKIVPLLFALGTLVALFVFLRRYFGDAAATAGGALFVLAPPGPTRLSLLAMGFHTESVLLIMLTLLCWYRFVFGTSRPRLFLALFGLCAGLGCSFTYITATATVGCLASWPLLQRPRPSARAVGCLVLGVGVGLAPWLAYNLTHDFEGVRFLIGVFAPPSQEWASLPVRWARKIGALLVFGAPRAYGFTPVAGVTGSILSYAYWALIAVAAGGVALRGVRDPRLLPLALASGVVIAAYAASRFEIPRHALPFAEFRFLHPLHLLLLLLAAVGVSHRRAAAVAGALVVLGGIGQAEAAWHRPAPRVIDYRGYSYVELGYLWQSRLYPGSATFAEAQPLLRRFPGPERRAIYRGLVTFGSSRWIDPTTALRRIGEVDDEYRVYLAQAVGQALGVRAAHGHDAVARLAETLAGEERDHFAFGYASGTVLHAGEGARAAEWSRRVAARGGRWGSWSLGELAAMRCYERDRVACAGVTAAFATLRGADRADAYRGLGRVLAGNWIATATIDLDRLGDLVLPVEHRADIAWGIGWGLREVFSEDRIRVLDWVAGLPVDRRPPAREGVRAADAWYRLEGGD